MDLLANHTILLKDQLRMQAYDRAIRAAIKPGDTVADIGCGLGVLSHLAVQAGAAKVYAIEYDPSTLMLAQRIAEPHKWSSKIQWKHGLSGDLKIPKVDVIISETLGSLGLDENCLPTLLDARRRFLKPSGIIIPRAVTLHFAPVEISSWNSDAHFLQNVAGVNYLPDTPDLVIPARVLAIEPQHLLAEAKASATIDFLHETSPIFNFSTEFTVSRTGVLSGFAGWFNLNLHGDINLMTSPADPETHWQQGFLPLRNPQPVKKGQTIRFQMIMEPDQLPTGVETLMGYDYHVT